MLRLAFVLAAFGVLGLIPNTASAKCFQPPKVEKMIKPPLCKKPQKVGEDYMGKCAAVDATQCCDLPRKAYKCKCK